MNLLQLFSELSLSVTLHLKEILQHIIRQLILLISRRKMENHPFSFWHKPVLKLEPILVTPNSA